MSNRLKRGLAPRLVVGLVVLAFPLLAAGAANAALAGATPAQFTGGTPNLRSATINSTYSNVVEVCFDRTINGIFTFNGFLLGGHASIDKRILVPAERLMTLRVVAQEILRFSGCWKSMSVAGCHALGRKARVEVTVGEHKI